MKYKIGQILKVKKGCEDGCFEFKSSGGRFIKIVNISKDGDCRYEVLDKNKEKIGFCGCFTDKHLEPITKTLRDMEVGDIIVDWGKVEAKVLEVLPNSFLKTYWGDFTKHSGRLFTFEEAEGLGWKLKTQEEPEVEEMTVADVCKELGREVKIVK